MSTVNGLVFNRGVPPWIVKNHVRCRCQVETCTTRFKREHEYGCIFGGLETFDDTLTVLRLSGQVMERATLHFKTCLDDIEHRYKLREHQHLVTLLTELIEQVEQGRHLGTFFLEELRINQARVTTDLAKTHQPLKNSEGVLFDRFVRIKS